MPIKRKNRSENLNDIISQNIRGIIFGAGDTVQDFAAAMGVNRNAVWNRFSGRTFWAADEIQFVCERYNVPIERLVNGYTGQQIQIKSRY